MKDAPNTLARKARLALWWGGVLTLAIGGLSGCADKKHAGALDGIDVNSNSNSTCSTPQEGCPCTDEGDQVDCGVMTSRTGDVVSCREGIRTCTGGNWGDCSGDEQSKIFSPGPDVSGVHELALADASVSCQDPCDPYCMKLADTPSNLDAGTSLSADPGGLTLPGSGSVGGSCPSLSISPISATIKITAIAANGTVTATPSPQTFTATCNGSGLAVQPSWTIDSYSRAVIDSGGNLTVYSAFTGSILVTGASSLDSKNAVVDVNVDVEDRGGSTTVASAFDAGANSMVADTGSSTLYPYKGTVFPLDLKAPLVQWKVGTAATDVKVSLRYPQAPTAPTFLYSKIYNSEPHDGTLDSTQPAWQIPQQVWTAFDRSVAGNTGEIVIQRRYGGVVHKEQIIPVTFATQGLRGTVYYTQYNRTLTNSSCGGDGQSNISAASYAVGNVCPVGNCTHPSIAGASTTRAIDLSSTAATNKDPFNGTAGCPVCHSVSANGGVYVSGGQNWQTSPSGTSVGIDTIGLSGGNPTFTAVGPAPNYTGISSSGDANGEDGRGFSYSAITPDGSRVFHGPKFWGNTIDASSTTVNNQQDGGYKGTTNKVKPYFIVGTAAPGLGAQYATTAALVAYTVSGTSLTSNTKVVLTVDGVNVASGNSVLVKDETGANAKYNGLYTVATVGVAGSTAWKLTRRTDIDSGTEMNGGMEFRITDGNTNYNTVWYVSSPASGAVTINTTSVTFSQRTGLPTLPTMMTPVISPDGTKVAYVNGDADTIGAASTGWRRGLSMFTFNTSTLAATAKTRLINNWNAVTTGTPMKWPFFEGDSRSLVYVETDPNEFCSTYAAAGHCPTLTAANDLFTNAACASDSGSTNVNNNIERACYNSGYGNMSPTTRGFWPGRIFSIDTSNPGSTRHELTNLDVAEDTSDANKAYQPTVLSNSYGGYRWIIFTSPRAYGNQFNIKGTDFSCSASMLWVSAIKDELATNKDRSNPAFFLPGQNVVSITTQNHYVNERGYMVPSPCKSSGSSCTYDDECCGGSASPATAACRVPTGWTPASGVPSKTCATFPAGTCATQGNSCNTSADCCGGAPCSNFTCQAVAAYTQATFTRDYVASCASGTHPQWGFFEYHLTTNGDSKISFATQTASTSAGLSTATSVNLGFDTNTTVSPTTPDTINVGTALKAAAQPTNLSYLRMSITLVPSTDAAVAPVLHDWEQRYSCVQDE